MPKVSRREFSVTIGGTCCYNCRARLGKSSGDEAMASAGNLTTSFEKQFRDALDKANRGAVLWSLAYHGSGILSVLASAGAAFLAASDLPQLSGTEGTWIAALSGCAATLTTVSTFTG